MQQVQRLAVTIIIVLWGVVGYENLCLGQVLADSALIGHYRGCRGELVFKKDQTFLHQKIACMSIKWKGKWALDGNLLVLTTSPITGKDELTWEGQAEEQEALEIVLEKRNDSMIVEYTIHWVKAGKWIGQHGPEHRPTISVPQVTADSIYITFEDDRPTLAIAVQPMATRLRIHVDYLLYLHPPFVKGRWYPKKQHVQLEMPCRERTRRHQKSKTSITRFYKDSDRTVLQWQP